MSIEHHGAQQPPIDPTERAAMDRILDEIMGKAERTYPHGRVSGDDLGEAAFAIAADPVHRIIRIQFTKPMTWLGLDLPTATKLRDLLAEKIRELINAQQS